MEEGGVSWNHRVVRQVIHGEEWLGIHETFYDIDGGMAWTEEPGGVVGESVEDLRVTLERMLSALDRPVIDGTKP